MTILTGAEPAALGGGRRMAGSWMQPRGRGTSIVKAAQPSAPTERQAGLAEVFRHAHRETAHREGPVAFGGGAKAFR